MNWPSFILGGVVGAILCLIAVLQLFTVFASAMIRMIPHLLPFVMEKYMGETELATPPAEKE